MDSKTKGKIINAVRRLSFSHRPRNEAKAKQKRGPATWQCESCDAVVYTGKKKEIPAEVLETYPDAIFGKVELDHKVEVVPLEGFPNGKWDWNIFLENLFCDVGGFQVLCSPCHDTKSYMEKEIRKDYRKLNKEKKIT